MNKALALLAVFLLTAVTSFSVPAAAKIDGKGVALVIGNSAYAHAVSLPNPSKDATLMAATLREAGFEVIDGVNLDKNGMTAALDRFTEKAYDADVALIYYAGHGMQVDGKNFLIPVDAELTSPAHLKTRTIEAEKFLAALPPDPAVGVIILDACRDNPLARTLAASLPASRSLSLGPGLAPVQTVTNGTGTGGVLIAYATDPGAVAFDGKGANSPYTLALTKYLTVPGVELQSALTKVRGDVTTTTAGRQRPWANASLGREVFLGGPAPKAAPATAAAAPSAAQPLIVGKTAAAEAASSWEIERRLWDEASKRNTIAHFEAYLAQFPTGSFASIARLNIDQLKAAQTAPQVASVEAPSSIQATGSAGRTAVAVPEAARKTEGTPVTESLLGLDREKKLDLQLRLEALGFDLGRADGSLGRQTRRAIGAWQAKHDMPATTFLTPQQYNFLVVQTDPMMDAVRAQHRNERAAAPPVKAKPNKVVKTTKSTRTAKAQKTQKPPQKVVRKITRRSKGSSGDDTYVVRRVSPGDNDGGSGDFAKGVIVGAGASAIGSLIKGH